MGIAESMQKLTPEQKKLFNKKLAEAIAAAAKKFGQEIEKYQKDPYVHFNGKKIQKTLKQCIPYTAEGWAEYQQDKADRDNKQLISFIDKVFFRRRRAAIRETRHKEINMDTLELIQALPQELREKIRNEYIVIKLWQRKMLGWDDVRKEINKGYTSMKLKQRKTLGWDEVHAAIYEAPFCDRNKQIVRVLFCYKCDRSRCSRNGLCNLCIRNGFRHYLGYPIFDENDYDECFKRSFSSKWRGVFA